MLGGEDEEDEEEEEEGREDRGEEDRGEEGRDEEDGDLEPESESKFRSRFESKIFAFATLSRSATIVEILGI